MAGPVVNVGQSLSRRSNSASPWFKHDLTELGQTNRRRCRRTTSIDSWAELRMTLNPLSNIIR